MAVHKRRVRDRFDGSAELYDVSPEHVATDDVDEAVRLSCATREDVYLDVASGTGHAYFRFLPHVGMAVAADISLSMLKKLKSKYTNAFAVASDAEAFPFRNRSFSLISCRIAVHHFTDVNRFFSEVHRLLKRGGRFVLIDSAVADDEDLRGFIETVEKLRDSTHVRTYTFSEWRNMLSGFFSISFEGVVRKRHPFESWLDRACLDEKRKDKIRQMFLNADDRAKSYFEIEIKDGEVLSYTDDKILVVAEKR